MSMGKLHDIEGFRSMYDLKQSISSHLNVQGELTLSMGTSLDYEDAVMEGSTEVRVGTTIFGERDYT